MDGGWTGGLIGAAVGVLGGVLGTWASVRRAKGPRERALVVRVAALVWLVVVVAVGLMVWLPPPWRYLVWIPYGVLLTLGIARANLAQQRVREEEAAPAGRHAPDPRPPDAASRAP